MSIGTTRRISTRRGKTCIEAETGDLLLCGRLESAIGKSVVGSAYNNKIPLPEICIIKYGVSKMVNFHMIRGIS